MLKRALKHPAALLGVAMLLMMAALFATPAHAQATGGLTLNASPSAGGATIYSVPIQTLLIFSALPTSSSCYVLAARMGYHGAYVAGLVTLSTVLAAISLPWALASLAPSLP